MTADSLGTRSRLAIGGDRYDIFRLDRTRWFGAASVHPESAAGEPAAKRGRHAGHLAGTMHADLLGEPLGHDPNGQPVYLREIWPSTREINEVAEAFLRAEMFTAGYAEVFTGDDNWRSLEVPAGDRFGWEETSAYVRRPPCFDGMPRESAPTA
jgi:aconitate hydratase